MDSASQSLAAEHVALARRARELAAKGLLTVAMIDESVRRREISRNSGDFLRKALDHAALTLGEWDHLLSLDPSWGDHNH